MAEIKEYIFLYACKIIFSPMWLIIYLFCLFIYMKRCAFNEIGFNTLKEIQKKFDIDDYWEL